MDAVLLSDPGDSLIDVLAGAGELLAGVPSPVVAYVPFASVAHDFAAETQAAFVGLAQVEVVQSGRLSDRAARAALARADLIYLPGGNTYLLAQRLHEAGVLDDIGAMVREGVPLLAFSAGAVLCGPDILTTNDPNICGCRDFAGLAIVPFRLNVHYPADPTARTERDERLTDHLAMDPTPIVALGDGARIRVRSGETVLERGPGWRFVVGGRPELLRAGVAL